MKNVETPDNKKKMLTEINWKRYNRLRSFPAAKGETDFVRIRSSNRDRSIITMSLDYERLDWSPEFPLWPKISGGTGLVIC